MTIKDIVLLAIKQEASDVHLFVGQPPVYRIHGELTPSSLEVLSDEMMTELISANLNERQKAIFVERKDLDFSYSFVPGYDFRINVHSGEGKMAATIRILPQQVKTREELNLPLVVDEMARKRQGLIVVSGTAGSGKSTTMTYMLDLINRERKCKIITIEDPVEFHHKPKQSYILQREVGADTFSFATALKYALRQDPDVVVVGEMRDHESISMALTTAETGHLVLTTVHAPDAIETINRIVDVYPIGHRDQIFVQLSRNLLGIIAQTLVPRKDKSGRILATEILVSTVAIQNLIRRGGLVEVRGQMDADHGSGMHSLEWVLVEMMSQGLISEKTAKEYANYSHTMEHFMKVKETKKRYKGSEDDPLAAKFASRMAQKILVIDGNDHTRVSLVLKLNSLGYENVRFATTGSQGMEIAKKEQPDMVITDMLLPDKDGFPFCRELRSQVPLATKLILISHNISSGDLKTAEAIGITKLVESSYDHRFLIQALEEGSAAADNK
jgi:twitching motility protein PilT